MFHDLRYSLRALAKHPSFALAGVLVLGLAVGVNTAVFSLINSLLLRPLPVRAPQELAFVYLSDVPGNFLTGWIPELQARTAGVFSAVAGRAVDRARLRAGDEVLPLQGEAVSGNYFDLLSVAPRLGRTFALDEDAESASPVIVLSDALWRSQFNADPAVLGRTVIIDGGFGRTPSWRAFTVIGVAPAAFIGTGSPWQPAQYWVLIRQRMFDYERVMVPMIGPMGPQWREGQPAEPIARLKPGVTFASARAAVDAAGRDILSRSSGRVHETSFDLRRSPRLTLPFAGAHFLSVPKLAAALMVVATLLLVIAASNLAGMLMARGVGRRTEIAVRLSLGAGRVRLARQLLAESLLLATGGTIAGLVAARVLIAAATREIPQQMPGVNVALLSIAVPLDGPVVLFAIATCFLTAVLVGLGPAIAATRTDLLSSLISCGVVAPRQRRSGLRRLVLVPQIALSLVLLLVAGVLVRSLLRMELAPAGYEPEAVVLANVVVPTGSLQTPDERKAAAPQVQESFDRILGRITALPEVSSAAVTSGMGTQGVGLPEGGSTIIARSDDQTTNAHHGATVGHASPDYFTTMGIRLLRGRPFDAGDRQSPQRTAIVSERLAKELWPGRDPIGEQLAMHEPSSPYPPKWLEVVGVAESVTLPLEEFPRPVYYVPIDADQLTAETSSIILVRGSGSPSRLVEHVKQAIARADAAAIVTQARPLADAVRAIRSPRRFSAALLGASGVAGLILAALGIFGLMSYAVALRVGEIGVRMVLGAERRDIVRLVLLDGAGVTAAGISIGFALAFAAIRYASHAIAPLPDIDALTFVVVPSILALVVLLACYLPARRAAGVDPLVVIRNS